MFSLGSYLAGTEAVGWITFWTTEREARRPGLLIAAYS